MITLLGEFIEAVNFLNEPIISSTSAVLTVNTNDNILHKTISKVNAPGDFISENGIPWLQVNLTTQSVSAYRGSTIIRSLPVATDVNQVIWPMLIQNINCIQCVVLIIPWIYGC